MADAVRLAALLGAHGDGNCCRSFRLRCAASFGCVARCLHPSAGYRALPGIKMPCRGLVRGEGTTIRVLAIGESTVAGAGLGAWRRDGDRRDGAGP